VVLAGVGRLVGHGRGGGGGGGGAEPEPYILDEEEEEGEEEQDEDGKEDVSAPQVDQVCRQNENVGYTSGSFENDDKFHLDNRFSAVAPKV